MQQPPEQSNNVVTSCEDDSSHDTFREDSCQQQGEACVPDSKSTEKHVGIHGNWITLKKKKKNLLIPNWILVILISNWILLMSLKLFQFSHQRLLGRHIHGGLSGSFCLLFCSASNMSEKTESFYKSTDSARTKPKYVDCQLGNMAEAWRIVICCQEESHKQQQRSRAKDRH